jgi:hypothetical protein
MLKIAGKPEEDTDNEKILQCYMNTNGRSSCKGCNLSEECKKFKKFMKANSQYTRNPMTHTARMMSCD